MVSQKLISSFLCSTQNLRTGCSSRHCSHVRPALREWSSSSLASLNQSIYGSSAAHVTLPWRRLRISSSSRQFCKYRCGRKPLLVSRPNAVHVEARELMVIKQLSRNTRSRHAKLMNLPLDSSWSVGTSPSFARMLCIASMASNLLPL